MKEILLIAYYFDPFKGVGSRRMSYWAHAFLKDPAYNCTVITATPQTKESHGIHYVKDERNSWLAKFIAGYSWIAPLKRFVQTNKSSFDFVIISGGPFGHFQIASFFKKKYHCEVILDFRDPFSRNTRFNTFFVKDFVKVLLERNFLRYADRVITVNKHCQQLLVKHFEENKISIIENGYDESVLDTIAVEKYNDDNHHIVYSGSFYPDRNPTVFLEALIKYNADAPVKYIFHHIGERSEYLLPFKQSHFIIEHGQLCYKGAIEIMKKCVAGVIVTSGEPMESTTKVYDYIGCELDVLVVTSGVPRSGSIETVTAQVSERTFWSENDGEKIALLLNNYKPWTSAIRHKEKFSRNAGYKLLKSILEKG